MLQELVQDPDLSLAPGSIMTQLNNGIVFLTSHGAYLEYTDDPHSEVVTVYRTHVPDDVFNQHTVSLQDLQELTSDVAQWLQDSKSPDVGKRAQCLIDLATLYGWDHIDDDPLLIDEMSLQMRWYAAFEEEGICALGEKPQDVLPDLLRTLLKIDAGAFKGRMFPVVPANVLEDRNSLWWRQHGHAALLEVVQLLESMCPSGLCFEFRDGAYGFWRKSW